MLLGKGHKNVFKKINKILCSLRNDENWNETGRP